MNSAELRLTYGPDDEWHGELGAVVTSGAFSGRATAWFVRQTLEERFVRPLRSFPIDQGNLPLIEGGYWDDAGQGALKQCHLRVAIRPYDVSGRLLVQVDLATESSRSPDIDRQQLLTARFLTEYALLERFAAEFVEVLDERRDVAVLAGITA